MLVDFHTHTKLCKHATGEPAEYAAFAGKIGLAAICFTDHVPAPDGYDDAFRMSIDEYPIYENMIRSLRQEDYGTEILFGIEADFYDNQGDFQEQWLVKQNFDYVIGSVHYLGSWAIDNPAQIDRWKNADVTLAWKEYFKRVGAMADSRQFDAVGHIDLPKKLGFKPPDNKIAEFAKPMLDKIAEANMCIEINTAGLRAPAKEMYPSPVILSLAHEREIDICFGSDAHRPTDVGRDFDKAVSLAKEIGYIRRADFRKRQKKSVPLT